MHRTLPGTGQVLMSIYCSLRLFWGPNRCPEQPLGVVSNSKPRTLTDPVTVPLPYDPQPLCFPDSFPFSHSHFGLVGHLLLSLCTAGSLSH